MKNHPGQKGWSYKLHEFIYGTHAPAGKLFDITPFMMMLCIPVIVMMENMSSINANYYGFLKVSEYGDEHEGDKSSPDYASEVHRKDSEHSRGWKRSND